ncbi:hypothetical protein Dimus_020335 [Dionaea muscipula]
MAGGQWRWSAMAEGQQRQTRSKGADAADQPPAVAGQLTPRRRRPAHPTPSPSPSSISPDADNWPSANCHPPPQVSPIAPAAAVISPNPTSSPSSSPHAVAVAVQHLSQRRRLFIFSHLIFDSEEHSEKLAPLQIPSGVLGGKSALTKFRLKRKERCFDKKVRYESRKKLAEQRPRVKGQFVRQVLPDPPSAR